jgi:hypothetical protein
LHANWSNVGVSLRQRVAQSTGEMRIPFRETIKPRLQTGTKRKIKEALTPQRMVC